MKAPDQASVRLNLTWKMISDLTFSCMRAGREADRADVPLCEAGGRGEGE